MDVIDPEKSLSRQADPGSADKEFPPVALLRLKLSFSAQDMIQVKTWYTQARRELGDHYVKDMSVDRMIFEAFAGGAVNPSVVSCLLIEDKSNA